MNTNDFDYFLPKSLIAQNPIEPRDHSKLMLVNRKSSTVSHGFFYDLPDYLIEGDVLVFNNTKVIPARIYGLSEKSNAHIELLLLSREEKGTWKALVKPGKRMRIGDSFKVISKKGNTINGEVLDIYDDGSRLIDLSGIYELEDIGEIPLPPYIHKKIEDPNRYQTVYSKYDGSIAAPTAGLHFTNELLQKLTDLGVKFAYVTLHVGVGTFKPVSVDNIQDHKMHSEWWKLSNKAANIINDAKMNSNRIISVGTTSARLLEHVATKQNSKYVKADSGWADIFIRPGYEFKMVDGLITNFHLPKSTLLMLISAFSSKDIIFNAYNVAIESDYRFYSFGDAMFII
jgi:S-adenosylmethionine:tRNA ribosyltransferase-isomerase